MFVDDFFGCFMESGRGGGRRYGRGPEKILVEISCCDPEIALSAFSIAYYIGRNVILQ